jgi:hypothetical protein
MLKHYNKEAVKTMAKSPEEAEDRSNKSKKKTNSNKPPELKIDEGPVTIAKAKDINKQKELKELCSNVVKNP